MVSDISPEPTKTQLKLKKKKKKIPEIIRLKT